MTMKGTTICAVKRGDQVAIAGDGQVTMGENTVFKSSAKKERFEEKLTQCGGNLERAAVNLAQEWRGDSAIRKLESMLIVADKNTLLVLSGNGEVIDPDDGVCAIGSGGNFALAAARALVHNTSLSAEEIAVKALEVAASICVFTNDHITVETL